MSTEPYTCHLYKKYDKKNYHQSQSFFDEWPQNWYSSLRFVNKLGTMHEPLKKDYN